jgi:hypothetical protein
VLCSENKRVLHSVHVAGYISIECGKVGYNTSGFVNTFKDSGSLLYLNVVERCIGGATSLPSPLR